MVCIHCTLALVVFFRGPHVNISFCRFVFAVLRSKSEAVCGNSPTFVQEPFERAFKEA